MKTSLIRPMFPNSRTQKAVNPTRAEDLPQHQVAEQTAGDEDQASGQGRRSGYLEESDGNHEHGKAEFRGCREGSTKILGEPE